MRSALLGVRSSAIACKAADVFGMARVGLKASQGGRSSGVLSAVYGHLSDGYHDAWKCVGRSCPGDTVR